MSTATSPTLKQAAFGDLESELATTRRVIERLPEEHFAWKPHAKSMSLGTLADHTVGIVHWATMILQDDGFDLATMPPTQSTGPESRQELLKKLDEAGAAIRAALEGIDDEALGRAWTLRHGERVILTQPRLEVLRTMCLNHMINHRGQLCLYLRLLDVPVPSIYGPSADEPGGF